MRLPGPVGLDAPQPEEPQFSPDGEEVWWLTHGWNFPASTEETAGTASAEQSLKCPEGLGTRAGMEPVTLARLPQLPPWGSASLIAGSPLPPNLFLKWSFRDGRLLRPSPTPTPTPPSIPH